jgi:hypothetical protein
MIFGCLILMSLNRLGCKRSKRQQVRTLELFQRLLENSETCGYAYSLAAVVLTGKKTLFLITVDPYKYILRFTLDPICTYWAGLAQSMNGSRFDPSQVQEFFAIAAAGPSLRPTQPHIQISLELLSYFINATCFGHSVNVKAHLTRTIRSTPVKYRNSHATKKIWRRKHRRHKVRNDIRAVRSAVGLLTLSVAWWWPCMAETCSIRTPHIKCCLMMALYGRNM